MCLLSVLMIAACPGRAQRSVAFPSVSPVHGTLVAGGKRWMMGTPEMIVGPGVVGVLPSRDFRYLLIARETRMLRPDAGSDLHRTDTPGEQTLTWWNVRTHRARVVWQRDLKARETAWFQIRGWLGLTGEAVIGTSGEKPSNFAVLFCDPAKGTARTVPIPPNMYQFAIPSPVAPFAALVGADAACDDAVHFMRPDGTLTDPVSLPGTIFFTRWSDDGRKLYGMGSLKKADGTATEQWYAIDPVAHNAVAIPEPKRDVAGEVDYENFPDPAAALPLRLVYHEEAKEGTKRRYSVWLQEFPVGPEHIALGEGEPAFLLPDGTGLFFRRDGALYYAPLIAVPLPHETEPVSGNSK